MSNGFKRRGDNDGKKDNPFLDDINSQSKKPKKTDKVDWSSPKDKEPSKNKPQVSIKYRNSMSRTGLIILVISLFITICSLIACLYFHMEYSKSKLIYNENIGTQIVNDLYSWGTVQVKDSKTGEETTQINATQIANNMKDLQSICTPQAYDNNTIENGAVTLSMYLQFGQHASRPNIVAQGPGYVLFTIVSPNIDPSEMFQISYKVNDQGKVSWIFQGMTKSMMKYGVSEWA